MAMQLQEFLAEGEKPPTILMQWRAGGGGSSELLRALHLLCFLPLISKAVFESNWTGVRELSPLKSLQAEFADGGGKPGPPSCPGYNHLLI
eukprot:1158208-Pelagomonas_calceolata.AAC.48